MNAILSQFDSGTLDQLSNQLGTNQQTTGNAIAAAVPLLLSALSRNAGSDDGRDSLYNALSKDHDGGILNDLTGFLGGANSGPGQGILRHVFGGSQNGAVNALSRATGMDSSSVGRLLATVAPIVMGFLGRTRQQQAMGPSGVAGLLGGETEYAQRAAPTLIGAINRFFDQNGNGSAVDELAGIMGSMLSRR
ncbi:MAG: DUF937 domain-containing protein [Pseudomonadota bacterium]|nr:DUF937 domain-containing protein [Pseudomonadota bacterium]